MLFEHVFELENEPQLICMTLCTESFVDQTAHFTDAFVQETMYMAMTWPLKFTADVILFRECLNVLAAFSVIWLE